MLETVAFTGLMLNAGCLITCMPPGVESINIKYPEASIKDQPMTARSFVKIVSI